MPNINLSKIKSPGITTIEVENNLTPIENSTLNEQALVIGFSRVGPSNEVIRLTTVQDRLNYYGDIDTFLEKRGSYFHRTLDILLTQGPVLALNILPLDNSENGDKVDYLSLSTSTGNINPSKISELYSSFFQREGFWKPSRRNFLSIIDSNLSTKDSILSFVNLSKEKYTILVKKTTGIENNDFNITALEYYGKENIPDYIDEYDNMLDYFVDVYVIKGDYSDYSKLSTDPIYSKYFDSNGLKKTAINSLESSTDFNLALSVTGSILPEIVDGNNTSYSIDDLINSYFRRVGLYCIINEEYLGSMSELDFNKFDMIGHSFVDEDYTPTQINFLSYKFKLIENLIYDKRDTFVTNLYQLSTPATPYENINTGGEYGLFSNKFKVNGTAIQSNIVPNSSLIELTNNKYGLIKSYNTSSGNTIVTYQHTDKQYEGSFSYLYKSSNVSANSITIEGIHDDFGYSMTNEYLYATNGTSKYYYKISNHSTDVANNTTSVTVSSNTNISELNGNYKLTWSSGYDVTNINATSNTLTFKGIWDMDTLSSSFVGNVIYLKNNASKTGNIKFSSHSVSNNSTTLYLVDAKLKLSNGSVTNLISTNSLSELINNKYYVTFGDESITKPNIESSSSKIVHTPNVIISSGNSIISYKSSDMYKDYITGNLTSSDNYYKSVSSTTTKYYIGFQELKDSNGLDILKTDLYTDFNLTTSANTPMIFGNKKSVNSSYEDVTSSEVAISSKIGNMNRRLKIENTFDDGKRIRLDSTNSEYIKIGDYINSYQITNGSYKYFLSKVITKKRILVSNVTYYDITIYKTAKIIQDSGDYFIERYDTIENFTTNYNLHYMNGFNLNEYHLPGNSLNKNSQLEKILSTLENTGLKNILADRNVIDYRYIIDTFDSPILNQMGAKVYLSRLAKAHGKSIAFLNTPSKEDFVNSTSPNPIFKSTPTNNTLGVFNSQYIVDGGNLELSPDFLFTFPSEDNGGKHTAVFGPHFNYATSNGKLIKIPASGVAGYLFMRKNLTGDIYKITSGVRRGYVDISNILGVESLSESDIQTLDKMGYNGFLNKSGYGIVLYNNNTVYQNRKSPLNKLHVRDTLNSIERDLETILERYIFEGNTNATRFLVYEDVNAYLGSLRGTALYTYSIKIDDTNNTGATIDQSIGILEISVTPVMGLESFVNIIDIKRNSGISLSGFIL